MKKNIFKNKVPTLFKKRNFFKIKKFPDLKKTKESFIFFKKPCRFEVKKFIFLKRKFKKLFKKSKYFYGKKIIVFLNKNYPFSKKSKNARMGKGKGKYKRSVLKFEKNHILFKISGFKIEKIIFFLKRLFKYGIFLNIKYNYKYFYQNPVVSKGSNTCYF